MEVKIPDLIIRSAAVNLTAGATLVIGMAAGVAVLEAANLNPFPVPVETECSGPIPALEARQ